MSGEIYGIIAGQGDLPKKLIQQCQLRQEPVFVIAFEGQTDPETVKDVPHFWTKLGAVSPILNYFKSHKVTHLILAGAINRPSLSELSLDWAGTKLITRIGFKSLGDDGLLSAIISYLEEEGFKVLGADDLLKDLVTPKGSLTLLSPIPEDLEDIKRGIEVLLKLGEADVGQAAIIQQGLVLGLEAIEGTSKLIERISEYKRPGRGGILVKMAKPNQNLRVDLPTIGPETIDKAISSGLVGIAVESSRSQILNRDEAIKKAEKAGIFIYGFSLSSEETTS